MHPVRKTDWGNKRIVPEIPATTDTDKSYNITQKTQEIMEMNEYQKQALKTAIYPHPIVYPVLGLTGEAGEVADKVKKVIRDQGSDFSDGHTKEKIAKEIGDVLWYLSTLANDLGYTLDEIAEMNIRKIQSRQQRDKIHGAGDNR